MAFCPKQLLSFLPENFCRQPILGVAIWRYLSLLFITILVYFTYKVIPYCFNYAIGRLLGKPSKKYIIIERILLIFVIICYLKLILFILQLHYLAKVVDPVLTIAYFFIKISLAYGCITLVQEHIGITRKHSELVIYVLPLCSMIAKVIIGCAAIVKIIKSFGFEVDSLLNILAFGSFGIGLAAKDTIQNVFGSFMIMVDRPFMVGDEIATTGIRGSVEQIGLRATLLRTKEGSLIYIPNGKLADAYIDNLGRRKFRMINLEIPISYEGDLKALSTFTQALLRLIKSQPLVNIDKTTVHMDNMKEYSLVITCCIYLDGTQRQLEQSCKNNVIPHIIALAHQFKLRLGSPIKLTMPGEHHPT